MRKRISRGTLRSDKDADGTVRVYVPPSGTTSGTATSGGRDELVGELRERVRSLERTVEAEREANRENRRIIAALTSRIPELEAPQDALRDERGSPTNASEPVPDSSPPEAETGGERRRSWWREFFGFGE